MKENLESSLKAILHHEGGYVNHPKDPGGETNLGVTKRVYEEYGGKKDMKDLVVADVAPIYIERYWNKMKCDDLPGGLDLCVFDFGVNAGPGRAAKFLQRMIGVTQDGGIGPQTLGALQSMIGEDPKAGVHEAIEKYQSMRQEYYESLSTFSTFGKGWTRRVEETTKMALDLI